MHNPHARGTTIPSGVRQETERRIRAYAREPLCWHVLSIGRPERSATSTPTSSPSPLHADSFACSRRHARSTSTGYARFHSTSVGCDTSAATKSGAWRSTPTATNAMSRAHSPTARFTAPPVYGTPEEAFEVGAVYLRARSGVPGPRPRKRRAAEVRGHRPRFRRR